MKEKVGVSMETKIPEFLYRGVVIDYSTLKDFHFFGVDLSPFEKGTADNPNKRQDGNEVGIYMSDNPIMVNNAYGNAHSTGTSLSNTIRVGYQQDKIGMADIGICYQIKTQGLAIRKPFVSNTLMGHYNNGFAGDEYITDFIPKENVTVTRIQIGEDYLHDEEFVNISDIEKADIETKRIMEERKRNLQELLKSLEKMTPLQRKVLGEQEQITLRHIFGKNGVKWKQAKEISLDSANGILTRLRFDYYHNSPEKIDFKNLNYLNQLSKRLLNQEFPDSIDSLLELIEQDIIQNEGKKEQFIKRRMEEGEPVITTSFDAKEEMFSRFHSQIKDLQKEQKKNKEQKKEEQKSNTLRKIEMMLQIQITPTKGYMVDPQKFNGVPYSILKTTQELEQEQEEIIKRINSLYLNGTIDLGTADMMKKIIIEEYEGMKQISTNSISSGEFAEAPKSK